MEYRHINIKNIKMFLISRGLKQTFPKEETQMANRY